MKRVTPGVMGVLFAPTAGIAAQMANAPRGNKGNGAAVTVETADRLPEPTGDVPNVEVTKNRFIDGLFASVTFVPASPKAQVYGADEGRASKKLASVFIEVGTTRARLKGAIKAIQNTGEVEPHAEFSFMASMQNGQCFDTVDAQAAIELEAFKAHVEDLYMAWRKVNAATTTYTPTAARSLKGLSLL